MSFVQLVDLPDFGDVLPAWIAEATTEAPKRRRRAESYADRPEDVVEAVRRLAAAQAAVQGAGGDHCTFVACCVGRDLSLSPEVFEPLLLTWNERCAPPWSAGELRTKMRNAYRYAKAAEPGQSSAATLFPDPIPDIPGTAALPQRPPDGHSGVPAVPAAPVTAGDDVLRPAWLSEILYAAKGTWRSHPRNVELVLTHDPDLQGCLAFNLFSGTLEVRRAPWRAWDGPLVWTDDDPVSFANWMAKRFDDRPAITPEAVQQAVQPFARRHSYDPVRTMLESVTWDGEQRAQHWLATTFGSPDTPYVRAVALRFLISAVARIYAPGCKVDTVLALEGEQGLYKSSALRVLFGDRYFSDAAIDMASKDAAPLIRQCWCFELSEMTPTNRADVNVIKSFITRQTDRQRDAFARVLMDHPRRCVFVGTTNLSEYLRDATGGRRFWPVPVLRRGDLDWLRANRLQLWAEAVTAYKLGDPWWLTDEEEPAAAAEQEDRYIADDWEGAIAAWIERGGDLAEPGTSPSPMIRITGLQCYLGALAGDPATYRRETQTRISDCLRRLGWRRAVYRIDGRNVKGFIRSVAGPEVAS